MRASCAGAVYFLYSARTSDIRSMSARINFRAMNRDQAVSFGSSAFGA